LLKSKTLGYAVYVSTWDTLKDKLSSQIGEGSFVFTSLHIEEEINREDYALKVDQMLKSLKQAGYKILADVSKRTLSALSFSSFQALKDYYDIDAFRLDFGFTFEEMVEMSQIGTICVNASMQESGLQQLHQKAKYPLLAMHNFYPRSETGLDLAQLSAKNRIFNQLQIPVLAFMPSNIMKRGPLHEGLPTCEVHRLGSPLSSLIELLSCGSSGVVVGDGVLSPQLTQICLLYLNEGIVSLPIKVSDDYAYLYHQVMTIRDDSPSLVCRLLESRLYATQGQVIEPNHCVKRIKGSLTIDNKRYLRYSGEIQILKEDFKADDRVNVIGYVTQIDLLRVLEAGMKVRFIKEDEYE